MSIIKIEKQDQLTGILNQMFFIEACREDMKQAALQNYQMALYVIHICDLKHIVMNHGLPVAEMILKNITSQLYGLLQSNKIFARLEGETLGLWQRNVEHQGHVLYTARRILEKLEDPTNVLENKLGIRIKIGIALFPDHGGDWDMLYQNALSALNDAQSSKTDDYKIYAC